MSDHQQQATELYLACRSVAAHRERAEVAIAAALAAAEQRGRDEMRAAVVAVINDWEEGGTPLGYYATRRLREAIGAE